MVFQEKIFKFWVGELSWDNDLCVVKRDFYEMIAVRQGIISSQKGLHYSDFAYIHQNL